jgi:UDP-GlcNAc:undecaprenyl-phosphate GlcNAc-1-phosphate transferase
MIVPGLGVLLCAFILACALIPLARKAALRWGPLDHPDGRRKIHAKPIPLVGGPVILLAVCVTLIGGYWFNGYRQGELTWPALRWSGVGLAAALICLLGVLDDLHLLRGRHKLLGQIAAALLVALSGFAVQRIHIMGWEFDLGVLAVPLTVFWLLGAINSLNLIDGMDGLLSSVGLMITLGLAVIALYLGQWQAFWISLALMGALAGILCFNFPPASIFLGDSGSMLVGLLIGTMAVAGSIKGPATVALAAPVALMALPIMDTTAAIVRRKLTGRSIYSTDRGHLHHCLQRSGRSARHVLLLVGILSLCTLVGVLVSMIRNNELYALVSAGMVVCILILSKLFGHSEAMLVKERLMSVVRSSLRRPQRDEGEQLVVRLQGSADWPALWEHLVETAGELNLGCLCLDVNVPSLHEQYYARWEKGLDAKSEENRRWQAQIPVMLRGELLIHVHVEGEMDAQPIWSKIAALSRAIQDPRRHPMAPELDEEAEGAASESGASDAVAALAPAAAGNPINGHFLEANITNGVGS